MAKKVFISILAVVVGLAIITLLTEIIEMLVISVSSEKSLTELASNQSEYFAIRNQPLNIGLKLFYNTLAAFVGGYICALIAKKQSMKHCIALAFIQTAGFIYGMTLSEYADTTPLWLWFSLLILTVAGILLGGNFRSKRAE